MIEKNKLIAKIAKSTKISTAKAQKAYEIILKEGKAFRKQSIKNVKTKEQVPVSITPKSVVRKVEVKREVPVVKTKEVVKTVQVIKEVPVIQYRDRIKKVEVIKEVPVEVIKEVTLVNEVFDRKQVNTWKSKSSEYQKQASKYKNEWQNAEKKVKHYRSELDDAEKD